MMIMMSICGWIMPKLLIKRQYNNGKVEYFKIKNDGNIIEQNSTQSPPPNHPALP